MHVKPHQKAVPEGMYIVTYYLRPGQSWSVLEGEGVAFSEDSCDLVAWPTVA